MQASTPQRSAPRLTAPFLVLLVSAGLFTATGCENKPAPTNVSDTATSPAPRGVPRPADTFGAVAVDIDRVVLTARTPVVLTDAGLPTGDDAHPDAWETSDPDWIAAFVRAVGPDTPRTEKPPAPCPPWADLTLYSEQRAVASFAVACPEASFRVFYTRPPSHAFVASDSDAMASLIKRLRRE